MKAVGNKKVLYAAFDAYPGFKGAQAHIRANLHAMQQCGAQVTLLCLGQGGCFQDRDSDALVHAYSSPERNMLRRSELFGSFLSQRADAMMSDPPDIIHFRDIWSGIPLLSHPLSRNSSIVFEVNGLPSVELPSHHPQTAQNRPLLARLCRLENECLIRANRVITVCRRTVRYLVERGCDERKIAVIPNAADPRQVFPVSPAEIAGLDEAALAGKRIVLYTGTLAPWQGVQTLLEAVGFLGHRDDFHLIAAAANRKGTKRFLTQAAGMGLNGRVTVLQGTHHTMMPSLYSRAYMSVAPLSRGARNELQGCCPLKIVESMSCGTPVVASDLPVTRELINSPTDGLLVSPGAPRALAGALELLLENLAFRNRLALGAYDRAQKDFGLKIFAERLYRVYNWL